VTIEDGRISRVGPAREGERLAGKALAPGFVNNHSHAFQRGLRDAVERAEPWRPRDDFWTWRERMYAVAEELSTESIRQASRRCYEEMLSAEYTSVTEFHYVHHRPDGMPYEDSNALEKAVALVAEAAGIRLSLLLVAHEQGGLPRFRDPSALAFLARVDDLKEWSEGRRWPEDSRPCQPDRNKCLTPCAGRPGSRKSALRTRLRRGQRGRRGDLGGR
jgi:formimidoylglutamate deiminase